VKEPFLRAFFASVAVALAVPALAIGSSSSKPRVLLVDFPLEVNPVTANYLDHQIHRAQNKGYNAVVIQLDTPGGLSDSMRTIVKNELSSKIPVIVYVAPPGARAASAGVWIGQAADELAMAPATNIGSSTPIESNGANIGSDLRRKVVNDAAASLSGLSKFHGRNPRWAERAVREGANVTAEQALALNVIDDMAPSLPALLDKIDGKKTVGKGFVLHTANAQIDEAHPGFFTRLLNALINPNILPLLFLAGLAGIGFEIFHPGVVLPGALGAVALVTALFGFAVLPISWSGLALILLGVALLVIDAHVASHGALTVSGLIALVVGCLMLFHNAPAPYNDVNAPLIIAFAVGLGVLWAFAIAKGVQIRRSPVRVGVHMMVGEVGEARRDDLVFVNGELWRARSADGEPLRPGQSVRVSGVDPELQLEVVHVVPE
jgi:membrane-bound serine protease (ClpP class)